MAVVPNLVKSEVLKPANALISGSGTWALTFGALVTSTFLNNNNKVYNNNNIY